MARGAGIRMLDDAEGFSALAQRLFLLINWGLWGVRCRFAGGNLERCYRVLAKSGRVRVGVSTHEPRGEFSGSRTNVEIDGPELARVTDELWKPKRCWTGGVYNDAMWSSRHAEAETQPHPLMHVSICGLHKASSAGADVLAHRKEQPRLFQHRSTSPKVSAGAQRSGSDFRDVSAVTEASGEGRFYYVKFRVH